MIFYVDTFTDEFGGVYVMRFDSSAYRSGAPGAKIVEYTAGSGGGEQLEVSEEIRGHLNGTPIGSVCDGTIKYEFFSWQFFEFFNVTETIDSPDCSYVPPVDTCNLGIDSVAPTPETATGADDGTVTINASSTHGPILYSLDNVTFQSSNIFTLLAPGNYAVYVKDALMCLANQGFNIPAYSNPVQNFSSGLPVVTIPTDNVSRWNAAFNPIVINYQRKDAAIASITQLNSTQIVVLLTIALSPEQYGLAISDALFVKSTKYNFYGVAASHTLIGGNSQLTITTEYLGDDTDGFIVIPNTKKNYYIETEITSGNNPVRKEVLIATHTPDKFGATIADLSTYLQTLLSAVDLYDYLMANYRDYNLGASFTVRYREVWDTGSTVWFSGPYPLYVTYAAMQLGEAYGGNMAAYVPFLTVLLNKYKAKWLTGFISPTRWKGLPFELSFIYSENVINKQLYLELVPDSGTTENGLLLNADATYLLDADSSRFIIERVYNPAIEGYPIIEKLGINRVLIPDIFSCATTKIVANIYYLNEDSSKTYIMQPITIKHECPCEDPYVYLKWLNRLGAWDYWRFGYNQIQDNESSNSQQVSRFVLDWANGETINDYISRTGNDKLTVLSGQVEKTDMLAIRWANNGIKTQMLTSVSPIKWQTILIPDGNFGTYNTKQAKANVKLNITFPDKNIQQQ